MDAITIGGTAYELERLGPTLYRLTKPGAPRPYVVDTARPSCDCPAGGWGRDCKHKQALIDLERRESMATAEEIQKALAAPFPADAVGWKPQSVKGNRALAIAYIDARDVMDRLDAVVGVDGWHDDYQLLPDGAVVCKLTVLIDGVAVSKKDVGGESDQPDEHDKHKAAFSDALKRAAVKFGIGRYIYRLDQQWCDYDPQSRKFTRTPSLPPWALPAQPAKPRPQPKGQAAATKPAAPVAPAANGGTARPAESGGGAGGPGAVAGKPAPKATEEQLERLAIIRGEWQPNPDDFDRRLAIKYGVNDAAKLTVHQAADLINLVAGSGKAGAA